MGAGRGAASVAVAALLPLLAGAAYADCYDSCFNDCMSRGEPRDYCSYACDSRCNPDAKKEPEPPLPPPTAALAGLPINCLLACVRTSCLSNLRADGEETEACYGHCYDSCQIKAALPRPLRAFRPAALRDHHFHKRQAAAPALPDHPFHKTMQDAGDPWTELDHDDVTGPAWILP